MVKLFVAMTILLTLAILLRCFRVKFTLTLIQFVQFWAGGHNTKKRAATDEPTAFFLLWRSTRQVF